MAGLRSSIGMVSTMSKANGKRGELETLIHVTFAQRVVMGPVLHRMGGRDPTHEPAHFTVLVRTQDQVPVIWHRKL